MKNKPKKPRIEKLTDQQREQNLQKRDIRNLMKNIGFSRILDIEGREFKYHGRKSELDEIFYFENILILLEYTIAKTPKDHLKDKKIIYDKINNNSSDFIKFLVEQDNFRFFKEIYNKFINKYSFNQLQIKILYASKYPVNQDIKDLVENIIYFDDPIVKYFESTAKVIKKSTKYEFFDFLQIKNENIGKNILKSSQGSSDDFHGHILPEEHSSFKEGYKLVSFYIDANSLLNRAFVLRKDGWRNIQNIGLYQRMMDNKKIRSMRKYLNDESRVFINNIIATIPADKIRLFDKDENEIVLDVNGNFQSSDKSKVQPATIKINNESNIIGIIDGQHRIFAYHEGDDVYEQKIATLRDIQNLLITGILYPKNEVEEKRIKFEAKLFLEINSTQTKAKSEIIQEIELILHPFSTISISKAIINKLNESGPLLNCFEKYWYEHSKLKTASIISFGLKPLVKFEDTDSIFKIWSNIDKYSLKEKEENYDLLKEYKEFCVQEIRNIFIGLYNIIKKENWEVNSFNKSAILNVTTINGIINCLRLIIENNKQGDSNYYTEKFKGIDSFNFKDYKSSQYRKMGIDIYEKYFNTK